MLSAATKDDDQHGKRKAKENKSVYSQVRTVLLFAHLIGHLNAKWAFAKTDGQTDNKWIFLDLSRVKSSLGNEEEGRERAEIESQGDSFRALRKHQ